jgi:hypothetical protein
MRASIVFTILIVLGVAAYASEAITYEYDAHGRLVQVSHTGSVNNNVVTNYLYDKADNRAFKNTTGAPSSNSGDTKAIPGTQYQLDVFRD